jgi:hypothetical protein
MRNIMAIQARFLVHDKSRKICAVTGQENYAEAIKNGFREVTAEEWDAFQVETRLLKVKKKRNKNANPVE